MDLLNNLALGFGVAFTPINLMYCLIGCILGTLIGVLPGIGPVATIAMLLPATYALPPVLLRRPIRWLNNGYFGELAR
jgi:TctA family transporter